MSESGKSVQNTICWRRATTSTAATTAIPVRRQQTSSARSSTAGSIVVDAGNLASMAHTDDKDIVSRITANPNLVQTQIARINYKPVSPHIPRVARKPLPIEQKKSAHPEMDANTERLSHQPTLREQSASKSQIEPPDGSTAMTTPNKGVYTYIPPTSNTLAVPTLEEKAESTKPTIQEEFNAKKVEREQDLKEIRNMLNEMSKTPKSLTPPPVEINIDVALSRRSSDLTYRKSKTEFDLQLPASTTHRSKLPQSTTRSRVRSKSVQPSTRAQSRDAPTGSTTGRSYNPEEARKYMKEQIQKRRAQTDHIDAILYPGRHKAAIEKEKIKKRLEDLRLNTKKLLKKSIRKRENKEGVNPEPPKEAVAPKEPVQTETNMTFKKPAERNVISNLRASEQREETRGPPKPLPEETPKSIKKTMPEKVKPTKNALPLLENQKRIGLLRKPETENHSFTAAKDYSFDKENIALQKLTDQIKESQEAHSKVPPTSKLLESPEAHSKVPPTSKQLESPEAHNKMPPTNKQLESHEKPAKTAAEPTDVNKDMELDVPEGSLKTRAVPVEERAPQLEAVKLKDTKSATKDKSKDTPLPAGRYQSDLPYWLRPSCVQTYPYNFIMAVRRKIEAIVNPIEDAGMRTMSRTTSTGDLGRQKPEYRTREKSLDCPRSSYRNAELDLRHVEQCSEDLKSLKADEMRKVKNFESVFRDEKSSEDSRSVAAKLAREAAVRPEKLPEDSNKPLRKRREKSKEDFGYPKRKKNSFADEAIRLDGDQGPIADYCLRKSVGVADIYSKDGVVWDKLKKSKDDLRTSRSKERAITKDFHPSAVVQIAASHDSEESVKHSHSSTTNSAVPKILIAGALPESHLATPSAVTSRERLVTERSGTFTHPSNADLFKAQLAVAIANPAWKQVQNKSHDNLLKSQTLSELSSNFSSISIKLQSTHTVSEVTSLKSEPPTSMKMKSKASPFGEDDDTTVSSSILGSPKKMSKEVHADHEFLAPRPVSPLSLERVEGLKIISKTERKKPTDKTASSCMPENAMSDKQIEENINQLYDDFNRSLSQIIQINKKLKNTVNKSNAIFAKRRTNSEASNKADGNTNEEYTEDFEDITQQESHKTEDRIHQEGDDEAAVNDLTLTPDVGPGNILTIGSVSPKESQTKEKEATEDYPDTFVHNREEFSRNDIIIGVTQGLSRSSKKSNSSSPVAKSSSGGQTTHKSSSISSEPDAVALSKSSTQSVKPHAETNEIAKLVRAQSDLESVSSSSKENRHKNSTLKTEATAFINSHINTSRGDFLPEVYRNNVQSRESSMQFAIQESQQQSCCDDSSVISRKSSVKSTSVHAIGKDTITICSQSDIELSIVSSNNINASCSESSLNYSNIGWYEKLIQTEATKSEHLTAVLKMREKALLDRTKGQIALLQVQKERYKERGLTSHIAAIKKKQREILKKMEKEREEIQRLLQSTASTTSTHSTGRLHTHSAATHPPQRRRYRNAIAPGSDPQPALPAAVERNPTASHRQEIPTSNTRYIRSAPIVRANYELESSKALEELLRRREEDLRKRREHAQRLIQWSQRLDQEEAEVRELEHMSYKLFQQRNAQAEPTHLQADSSSITQRSSARSVTGKRKEKMERRLRDIDKSLRELSSISNTTVGEPAEDYVRLTGSKLNKLWHRLTSQQLEKFEPNRRYRLCKSDLEKLYEEAKFAVIQEFSQNEERLAIELLDKSSNTSSNHSQMTSSNKIIVPPLEISHSSDQSDEESAAEVSQYSSPQGNYSPSAAEENFNMHPHDTESLRTESDEEENQVAQKSERYGAFNKNFGSAAKVELQRSLSDSHIAKSPREGFQMPQSKKYQSTNKMKISPATLSKSEIDTIKSVSPPNDTLRSLQSLKSQSSTSKSSSSAFENIPTTAEVHSSDVTPNTDGHDETLKNTAVEYEKGIELSTSSSTQTSRQTEEPARAILSTSPSISPTEITSNSPADAESKARQISAKLDEISAALTQMSQVDSAPSKQSTNSTQISASNVNEDEASVPHSESLTKQATQEQNLSADVSYTSHFENISTDLNSPSGCTFKSSATISIQPLTPSKSLAELTTSKSVASNKMVTESIASKSSIGKPVSGPPHHIPSIGTISAVSGTEVHSSSPPNSRTTHEVSTPAETEATASPPAAVENGLALSETYDTSSPATASKTYVLEPSNQSKTFSHETSNQLSLSPPISSKTFEIESESSQKNNTKSFVSEPNPLSQSAAERRLLDKYENDFEDSFSDESNLEDVSMPRCETTVDTTQDTTDDQEVKIENTLIDELNSAKGIAIKASSDDVVEHNLLDSSEKSTEKHLPEVEVFAGKELLPPPPPPPPPPPAIQSSGAHQHMPDIINELEIRRCQQILVENEQLKQYEHVTAVPYMYMREIPNKPPPPYVPPAHGSPMTTIFPSAERIKDITYRRTHELYCEILKTDYTNEKGEKLPSVVEEKITNIYERIILDICREYLEEHQEVLTEGDPTNFRSQLAFFNPPNRLACIQASIYKEVRRCLAMDKTPPKRSQVYSVYGQRAKRDHIGKIIIQEMYDEDDSWCNFHREENEVLELIVEEMIIDHIRNLAKEVLLEEGGTLDEEASVREQTQESSSIATEQESDDTRTETTAELSETKVDEVILKSEPTSQSVDLAEIVKGSESSTSEESPRDNNSSRSQSEAVVSNQKQAC